MHKGRVVFGAMDEVVFGRPAAEAVVEQMDRLGASRAFLMVSGTLNRETDEIENIRHALGARCVGTFDAMPRAYAARGGDRGHQTGPRRQGRPDRHRRRRLDHRRRQGGAALPRQRYRDVDGIDRIRAARRRAAADEATDRAADQRADHDRRRRVHRRSPASPTSARM